VSKIRAAVQGKDIEFIAVEKVHGSNFAFETDGRGIQYYSRSRRLDPTEKFVGRTSPGDAMQQYHAAVLETFRLCSSESSGPINNVLIYGEYFGGWYPHADVKLQGPGVGAPVQKGIVAYSPLHHFFAFDLCVDGVTWDFDRSMDLLKRAGFPLVATPLVRGSFEDCMQFDIEKLRSTLPELLGLPLCDDFCIAEGVIVKPVQPEKSWTMKRKSVRYLEGCPGELRKWIARCAESPALALRELYLCLCRRPRLDAVLSKEPQLRQQASRSLLKIQALFWADVEEDLKKKLVASKARVPEICLEAVHAEADARVAAWLLQDESAQP